MSRKWTEINESIRADRNESNFAFEEMSELDSSMAISEAKELAAEGRYIAKDILESFMDFNVKAEQRGLDGAEYIAEAFSVGGFFKKILDILVRFWGTIVNFMKAMFGKIGGTNGSLKELQSLKSEIEVILTRDLKKVGKDKKENASIKFKDYDLVAGAKTVLKLLDANGYVNFKITDDKTLKQLTEYVSALATGVAPKAEKKGEKPVVGADFTKDHLDNFTEQNARLEKAIKDLGLGDKGAAQILLKIVEEDAAVKAIVGAEKSKVKDAKKVSDVIRALLTEILPANAEVKETEDIEAKLTSMKAAIEAILGGTTSSQVDAGLNKGATLINGFEEARKQAQDILDSLKEAATKIGSFKATDVQGEEGDTNLDKLAEISGKLSTNLLEIQTSMQEVITKGMDGGVILLKSITAEIKAVVKSCGKLKAEGRKGLMDKDEE